MRRRRPLKPGKVQGEEFLVERNGELVCRIMPEASAKPRGMRGAEFADWWRQAPKPDPEFRADVEGAIQNQPLLPLEDPWERRLTPAFW